MSCPPRARKSPVRTEMAAPVQVLLTVLGAQDTYKDTFKKLEFYFTVSNPRLFVSLPRFSPCQGALDPVMLEAASKSCSSCSRLRDQLSPRFFPKESLGTLSQNSEQLPLLGVTWKSAEHSQKQQLPR